MNKIFFIRACMEGIVILTFLTQGFIFGHIFDPFFDSKKDKLFCHLFYYYKGISNAVLCDICRIKVETFHEYVLVQFDSVLKVYSVIFNNDLIQHRIETQMIAVNYYGHPRKCPQKLIKRGFFL